MTRYVPRSGLIAGALPTPVDFATTRTYLHENVGEIPGIALAVIYGSNVNSLPNVCSDTDLLVVVEDDRADEAVTALAHDLALLAQRSSVPINLTVEHLSHLKGGDHSIGGSLKDELAFALTHGGHIRGDTDLLQSIPPPRVDRWSPESYVPHKLRKLLEARVQWHLQSEERRAEIRSDALSTAVNAARKILVDLGAQSVGVPKRMIIERLGMIAALDEDPPLCQMSQHLDEISRLSGQYIRFVEGVRDDPSALTPGQFTAMERMIDEQSIPHTIAFLRTARDHLARRRR